MNNYNKFLISTDSTGYQKSMILTLCLNSLPDHEILFYKANGFSLVLFYC